jgi:hypothetical protein
VKLTHGAFLSYFVALPSLFWLVSMRLEPGNSDGKAVAFGIVSRRPQSY